MRSSVIFLLVLSLLAGLNMNAADDVFEELETVKLRFGDLIFSGWAGIEAVPDGFVILLRRGRLNNLVVVMGRDGSVKHVYDKPGKGPGEIHTGSNVTVGNGYIYVCEAESNTVHQFTRDLKFLKDYRIKRGGKLFVLRNGAFGVWGPNYTDDGAWQIALYDKDFNFQKYCFHVDEIPALFHHWGGIVKGPANTYAVFYPTAFQIQLFDDHWNLKKTVVKNAPSHIVPYKKWTGSPNHVDSKTVEWSRSWSVLGDIFFYKGNFILKSHYDNKTFLDVVAQDGKLLLEQFQQKKGENLMLVDQEGELWKLKILSVDEEEPQYFLVKLGLQL